MKIQRDWFRLYENILRYIKEMKICIEDVSSEFIPSRGNPKIIRKSYICLKNAEGALTIDEIAKGLRVVDQCAYATVKQEKTDPIKIMHCYSLRVINPDKCPLPNPSRKEDPEYKASYMREVDAWRRKNISLIEEVQLYYSD